MPVNRGPAELLAPPAAGRDTARRIRGAAFRMGSVVGHDRPTLQLPLSVNRLGALRIRDCTLNARLDSLAARK